MAYPLASCIFIVARLSYRNVCHTTASDSYPLNLQLKRFMLTGKILADIGTRNTDFDRQKDRQKTDNENSSYLFDSGLINIHKYLQILFSCIY